jgi:drug/metabolite transporter (DMT)-like permease
MYEWAVFASEAILSAYPILIKQTDASIFTQVGFRTGIFALAAMGMAIWMGQSLTNLSPLILLAGGLLNLTHVGASYKAFTDLSAGNAMALFYTYPIMNLVAASLTLGETIEPLTWMWMGVALVGAILIAQPSGSGWNLLGVGAALLAAATETGIYLLFRDLPKQTLPWKRMLELYGGSFLLWGGLALSGLWKGGAGRLQMTSVVAMVLFNLFIGFVGYGVRFFTIPKISTVAFSALSFFGILSAYIFGWLFQSEVPSWTAFAGAAAIILANSQLLGKAESV